MVAVIEPRPRSRTSINAPYVAPRRGPGTPQLRLFGTHGGEEDQVDAGQHDCRGRLPGARGKTITGRQQKKRKPE